MTPEEAARKIAQQIEGTPDSLQTVLDRHDLPLGLENNDTFCNILDSLVFECTTCNWWYGQSDMSEDPDHDWQCRECGED